MTDRIADLERALASEAQARREAEGEVEGLRDDVTRLEAARARWNHTACEIGADLSNEQERCVNLEYEIAGWKRVAVEAAIPLEVIRASKSTEAFCPEVRKEIANAIGIIRRAVMGEGLPPAPPPVPSSSKT